jgi:hemin uptake protein HemP
MRIVDDMASGGDGPDSEDRRRDAGGGGSRRVKVSDLLGHDREVILEHAGQDYRLRVTSKGKLILTK